MSETTQTKHKRGDVREDGRIFWSRSGKYEKWVTPEKFEKNQQMVREVAERQRRRRKMLAPGDPPNPTRLEAAIIRALESGNPRVVLATLDRGRAAALAKIRELVRHLSNDDRREVLASIDKPGTSCDIGLAAP